jgi:Pyruvate/2-oxoacid:ferredoxin oxidoreductase gamma subunit
VIRVRLHGRGGQGMKTAGWIIGSAAFRAGWTV